MLSIRFDDDHEWWVSRGAFDRLFASALARGHLASTLAEWRQVAAANGGLALARVDFHDARDLEAGLRAAALDELDRAPDDAYRADLERLVALLDEPPPPAHHDREPPG